MYDNGFSQLGGVGERRIEELVTGEAGPLGYRVLNGVLVDFGNTTAVFDHIIVDRHGILLVDVQSHVNATVQGTSADEFWVSRAPGKNPARFRNPLMENDRKRELLHRLLISFGRNLPERYVQSLVVFYGGDLSKLQLSEVDHMRVVSHEELLDFIRARYDFAPNEGAMADDVGEIVSLLGSMDRSRNAEVRLRHAENQKEPESFFGLRLPWVKQKRAAGPKLSRAIFDDSTRYPDGTHVRVGSGGRGRTSLPVLALMVVAGAALVLFLLFGPAASSVAGTVGLVVTTVSDLVAGGPKAPAPMPVSNAPAPINVSLAKQRVMEAFPDLAPKLENIDNPQVEQGPGTASYTWPFRGQQTIQTNSGAVSANSAYVTLDVSGQTVDIGLR